MVKKAIAAAVESGDVVGDSPQGTVIKRLSQRLTEAAEACQHIITSRSSPMEGAYSSDRLDQAAESSALDVQRAEVERAMATLQRIQAIQALIAEGWKGTCTAEKPKGGLCDAQISLARLEGALGTTVCIDCAGGSHRKRSHYR